MCQNIDTKDIIGIVSTTILAGTALIAPYISERLKYTYRKPKLKIEFNLSPPDCHLTHMRGTSVDFPVYYFRFVVKNIGKTPAEECEVFLEKIYKENSEGVMVKNHNFSPVNLKWSGIRDQFKRTIYPDKEMYCDIGRVHHPGSGYKSIYIGITPQEQQSNKFVFELPEIYYSQWDCLVPGKYKFIVSVYSRNSEKIGREFNLSWTGIWKDKEPEMFNELIIS